jgi:hypothetical protein
VCRIQQSPNEDENAPLAGADPGGSRRRESQPTIFIPPILFYCRVLFPATYLWCAKEFCNMLLMIFEELVLEEKDMDTIMYMFFF